MALSNKDGDSILTSTDLASTEPKVASHILAEIRRDDLTHHHLKYLHKAVLDPNKFEKEMNREITRSKKEIVRLERMARTKPLDPIEIFEKKNNLKILEQEKIICLRLAIEFRKEIETLKSPQDVDAYIDSINKHIYDVLDRPNDETNPLLAESYSNLLNHALNQFLQNQKSKKNKSTKSPKDTVEDIPLFALDRIESITDWEDARLVVDPLRRAIANINHTANRLREICINEASKGDKNQADIIREKYEILDSMKNYARTSKRNFGRRNNFSTALYSASSICTTLSNAANFARTIPGANLIANGVSKALEFLAYAFLTVSQAADPNVARTDRLAAKRHFEAMKNYNITETTLASVGTLSLAVGLIATAAGAATIMAPVLFVTGGVTLTVSNIISAERYRKEIKWLTSELNRQYEDLLGRKDDILSKNFDQLITDREKAFYRDAKKIEAYKCSYRKKVSDSIGTTLAACAALTVLLTIVFPPAGAVLGGAVLTTLGAATTILSLYSLYQSYKESKNREQFKSAENMIERNNINSALEYGNRLKLAQHSKPKVEAEMQEIQPIPKIYTPSFLGLDLSNKSDNEPKAEKGQYLKPE